MKKMAGILAIFFVFMVGFTSVSYGEQSYYNLIGTATSLTGKTSEAFIGITTDGNSYYANGFFDEINLFGRFHIAGQKIKCDSTGDTCFHFEGVLIFGGDGSGFPRNTEAPFILDIAIENNIAEGTYTVGTMPSFGIDTIQEGELTLSVKNATADGLLNVPYEYITIQDAIDSANDSDTIEVEDGVYTGTGNRNIDFKGKAITLKSKSGNPENCIAVSL